MTKTDPDKTRDLLQASFAVCCFVAVVAFSLFADTGGRQVARQNTVVPQMPSEEEIYTGSILFMPYDGNDCRQNLIDNLTGNIRENGVVACDAALSQFGSAQGRAWSSARVDAIRDGFSRR